MSVERTEEIGVKCHKCGAERGKRNKPWKVCSRCRHVFCLRCMNGNETATTCWECWNIEWNEKEEKRKRTPVKCSACQESKLPAEMARSSPPICKTCDETAKKVREAEKEAQEAKLRKRPGLVEVVYGRHPKPTEERGGYAYRVNEPVGLGDIVLVPSTWLDDVHEDRGPKEATVVATSSAYEGNISSILRVVEKR